METVVVKPGGLAVGLLADQDLCNACNTRLYAIPPDPWTTKTQPLVFCEMCVQCVVPKHLINQVIVEPHKDAFRVAD